MLFIRAVLVLANMYIHQNTPCQTIVMHRYGFIDSFEGYRCFKNGTILLLPRSSTKFAATIVVHIAISILYVVLIDQFA